MPSFSYYFGSTTLVMPDETNILSEYFENIERYRNFSDYKYNGESYFENVKDRSVEISSLFEGTYDPTTGLFTPVLKNNGGFTPTVALKSDKLSDGKSIRFPRLDDVLTDQRGVERLDSTCMGAYEMMEIDTVFVRDTIVLGETYAFNDKNITPEKIGWLQDTMLVKKDNNEKFLDKKENKSIKYD